MGIIIFIINALTGGVAKEIAGAIKAREEAKTDQERIAADERIAKLQNLRDVQIAEAGSPINAIVRALFAVPVALYYAKIFLIDKTLGAWFGTSTDALSPELTYVSTAVIGFYFIYEGVRVIGKRK